MYMYDNQWILFIVLLDSLCMFNKMNNKLMMIRLVQLIEKHFGVETRS